MHERVRVTMAAGAGAVLARVFARQARVQWSRHGYGAGAERERERERGGSGAHGRR